MSKRRNIIFIAPFPPPITGESLATELIYESKELHQLFHVKRINTNRRNINKQGSFSLIKLVLDVWLIFHALFYVYLYKTPILYVSLSQSKLGLLRDCILFSLASIKKCKIVTHLHGNNLSNTINNLDGISYTFVDFALKKIEIGIVLDPSLAFNYEGFVKDIRTVPNGVPSDFIRLEDLINKKNNEVVSILYFSNLIREKGYRKLVVAVSDLIRDGYNIELNLVGGIHDQNDFLEMVNEIKKNQLEDRIRYHGIKIGTEKKKFFLNGDVLVLPTSYKIEGQPISIIEGMASGLAIISTKRGAIQSMLHDCGILIEPNSQAIKQAIIGLYHNPEYRKKLGLVSREKYEKNYTEEIFIRSLIDIFLDVSRPHMVANTLMKG